MLTELLHDRILPFDAAATTANARIVTDLRHAGTPKAVAVAASCDASAADSLATLNTSEFAGNGLHLANLWQKG